MSQSRYQATKEGENKTHQRHIVHVINHHALVLGAILAPAAHVGLDDVAPVQERHLAVGLDPHLVARVRGDHVQRRHMQPKFARLGKLSQAGAQREQVGPRDRGGEVGERERHVVDARSVQAEDMPAGRGRVAAAAVGIGGGGRSDEVGERASGVVGEFGKESLRLGLGKRPHLEAAKKGRERGGGGEWLMRLNISR